MTISVLIATKVGQNISDDFWHRCAGRLSFRMKLLWSTTTQ